jgi:hypothetical protein
VIYAHEQFYIKHLFLDPHSTAHMADVRLASGTLAADRYYGPHLGQLLWGVTGFPRAARMRLINGFRKTQIFRWTLKLFH